MKLLKALVITAAAISLYGCASMSAVPANTVLKSEAAFTVSPMKAWTRIPKSLNPTTGSALTQDGTDLGVVYLVTAKDGKAMLDNYDRSKSLPRFVAGGTPLEAMDFVVTSIDRLGYTSLETTNVRADSFGGQAGTKAEITGKYPNGLNMRGYLALAETEDGLNVFVFTAPEMHYFSKYDSQVKALMDTVKF